MSSTGLSTRGGSALAYSGWWITGALLWWLERRNPVIRFHAAQSLIAFGILAMLIGAFGMLAIASLSFFPFAFGFLASAAGVAWVLGLVLWMVSMWKAVRGEPWRIPLAGRLADGVSREIDHTVRLNPDTPSI